VSIDVCNLKACSRSARKPDPEVDEINAIFYAFQNSNVDPSGPFSCDVNCVFVESVNVNSSRMRDFDAEVVSSELDLLNRIADIVCDLDPDVILGWEVQTSSWGYLTARGRHYGPFFLSRNRC
jgi:DNA polymerase zeta